MAALLLSKGVFTITRAAGHTPEAAARSHAMLSRLVRDDQGQDLIEYVLLGSFIAILAIAGVSSLGTNLNNWYSKVASWAAAQGNNVP